MSARDEILKSVRGHLPVLTERPDLHGDWITYDDPIAQFQAALEGVGGRCLRASDHEAAQSLLQDLPGYANASMRVSLVDGLGEPTVDFNSIADAHDLEAVDFAVIPAEFAVAENAAVWVHDTHVKHRAVYFICQHLAFIVPADQVVSNMHQAYDRLTFGERRFGVFISGPSKTADIEQSLVIGAHGPRSTTVILVG